MNLHSISKLIDKALEDNEVEPEPEEPVDPEWKATLLQVIAEELSAPSIRAEQFADTNRVQIRSRFFAGYGPASAAILIIAEAAKPVEEPEVDEMELLEW